MGGILLPTLADSVKHDLQHASKCSIKTVTTLRQLFIGTGSDELPKETKTPKRATASKPSSKSTRTVRVRGSSKNTLPPQPTNEENPPALSKHEKLVLATEVFNIASKLLSEHIKKHSVSRVTKTAGGNGSQRVRTTSPAKMPLQPTSPNPKVHKAENPKDTPEESIKRNGNCRIKLVAECAMLSLETLRSIRISEDTFDPNNLHLGQGINILVGKLLILELQDLAIKGLWMLKSTLLVAIEAERTKRTNGLERKYLDSQNASLESLLEFQALPENGPLLQLMVSFQSYALKVLLIEGNLNTSHKVLQQLRLGNPCSPTNTILAANKIGIIPDDRAAQQLQSHSQNVLTFSIILSPAEEKQGPITRPENPMVPLLLQFLALEIRCIWWKLSDHKLDLAKELWGPLSRFISTYVRRCPNSHKHEFDALQAAFNQLKARLESIKPLGNDEYKSSSMAAVVKTLGQIAYSAGRLETAAELCEASSTSLSDVRPLQRAVYQCRKALLKVESLKSQSTSESEAFQAVNEAATDLTASMKGNQNELDELLMESALLKKIIMKHISQTGPSSKKPLDGATTTNDSALAYLTSFLKFLIRYLAPAVHASQQDDTDAVTRYLQRSGNIVLAAIDSGIAVGKLFSSSGSLSWAKVEALLPICVSLSQLLQKLGPSCELENCPSGDASVRLLRISNLYWATYMRYKDLGKDPVELLQPVEQATSTLQHSALTEQISGLLAIKFERQAALYSEIGNSKKSSKAYTSAIHAHFEAGVLAAACQLSSKEHPRLIWKDPKGPGYALSRVLSCYIKEQIKCASGANPVIYDVEDLEPCQRATLLEQELNILMGLNGPSASSIVTETLPPLLSTILSLLPLDTYPIRRTRIIHQTLQYLLETNANSSKEFSKFILTEAAQCLSSSIIPSEDKSLVLFRDDLQASLMITVAFYSGMTPLNVFENAIQTWVVTVQGCESWEAVQNRIGDPLSLIIHLRSLSDYLEIRGLWRLRISALATVSQLLVLQDKPDFSMMVSCYSSIALQYCRLGIESIFQVQSVFDNVSADLSKETFQTRAACERLATDAATILSRSFYSKGYPNEAAYYAKRAVKLSSRLWARLEKYVEAKSEKHCKDKNTDPDTLADGIATLHIGTNDSSPSKSHFEGSVYWPYMSSHVAALLQLSRISDHNGIFQDAVYHGEQAIAVCDAVGSQALSSLIKAELGDRFIRAGRTHKGAELLEKVQALPQGECDFPLFISVNMHTASLHVQRKEVECAYRVVSDCINALSGFTNVSTVDSLDPFIDPIKEIVKQTGDMNISSPKKPSSRSATRTTRSRSARKPLQAKSVARSNISIIGESESAQNQTLVTRLHSSLIRKQAMLLLASQQFDQVVSLLDQADKILEAETAISSHKLCRVHYMLGLAVQQLSAHSVYCVLPESTISLPSLHSEGHGLKGSSRSKSRSGKTAKSTVHSEINFSETLSTASKVLADISLPISQHGSSKEGHEVSYLRSRTSMLAFATSTTRNSDTDPFLIAHSIVSSEEGCFMENYVEILPPEWDVISITLCPNQDEFIISKLRQGQCPLILRLPLKRGGDDDMDEDTFSFQEGKAELLEIIRLANASAHNTGTSLGKKEKKAWWETRENLDKQLQDLLQNIETVWFGGFRGIFSQATRNDLLLGKFTASFNKILDKHLPSRKEKRGKAKTTYPDFDPWVMELFVNIGRLNDEMNPEDAVMDLLYYVVDILQFHGETNAYEEIDFDMMVVETLDSLHRYADGCKWEQAPTPPRHTILVLDKSLHAFPWESMECLRNCSVSRMPSLDCVRDQILRLTTQERHEGGQFGFYANRDSGTYLLNPAGDLKSTEDIFKEPLSVLKGWSGRIKTAPTEEEFESSLRTKDILLYFGHGSGAQYIRGRTIRRLDKCAVTFLMGCSSGAMTEAGEFEPYGTPWNYMHAGTPALVATLWDVTDKDIDRFTTSVFERWGLFPTPDTTAKRPIASASGIKHTGQVGLDTAVAGSRDTCILKYLNGAAPVLYGVPVFLK
ncbi:separin, putative [Trichophyton benhamiae CBS 112371]|uniref:separase n=1 Tax=Arthroderma benhamiae (strain ATCC MYA-4681 / CBS 112371) TaxID=663331 RepID=D4AYL8_ARTBC|nr:separin, putative [Trichophyton benhamiae CBS 112371]EFE31688.1 separin, putative [Trichophyton benhamiae CBS 112371]